MLLTLLYSLLQINQKTISWTPTPQPVSLKGYLVGVRPLQGPLGVYPYQVTVGPQSLSCPLSALTPALPTGGTFVAAVMALGLTSSSPWVESPSFLLGPIPNPPSSIKVQ